MDTTKVFYYLDNSNIFHSAQKLAVLKEGTGYETSVRIQFSALTRLALNNREHGIGRAVVSKNDYETQKKVWSRLENEGLFDVEIYERGSKSNKEQAVDNALQLQMYRTAYNEEFPQIAVLMTGDGAGYYDEKGFLKAFVDLYNKGWGIELLSWEHSCHGELRDFVEKNGVFISLDDYYESITYVKGERIAKPLSLKKRKNSSPDYLKTLSYRYSEMFVKYNTLQTSYNNLEQSFMNVMGTVLDRYNSKNAVENNDSLNKKPGKKYRPRTKKKK